MYYIAIIIELRQVFKNGFLTLDASYNEGYKETSSKKTSGSRNHIFVESNFVFPDAHLDFVPCFEEATFGTDFKVSVI